MEDAQNILWKDDQEKETIKVKVKHKSSMEMKPLF